MMRWRNDNMLLRIGQADAYAMACEYVKESDSELLKKELLKFEKYHRHPTYHKLPAGTYTDDTQMSVSVAETLISSNFDTQIFSNNFFYTFKRIKLMEWPRAERGGTRSQWRGLLAPGFRDRLLW